MSCLIPVYILEGIELGMDVNFVNDPDESTPLMLASKLGQVEAVLRLIELGAHVSYIHALSTDIT